MLGFILTEFCLEFFWFLVTENKDIPFNHFSGIKENVRNHIWEMEYGEWQGWGWKLSELELNSFSFISFHCLVQLSSGGSFFTHWFSTVGKKPKTGGWHLNLTSHVCFKSPQRDYIIISFWRRGKIWWSTNWFELVNREPFQTVRVLDKIHWGKGQSSCPALHDMDGQSLTEDIGWIKSFSTSSEEGKMFGGYTRSAPADVVA